MKRILIYGDSITWGRIANTPNRYDGQSGYTGVLQNKLGEEYLVIPEGLRARMLKGENPFFHDRDGLKQFGPIFASQLPLDLVVIFLGTNDANSRANKSPQGIADGLDDYFEAISLWSRELEAEMPKVIIVSPPKIRDQFLKGQSMFEGAAAKVAELPELYKRKAEAYSAFFFDSSEVAEGSKEDGVHLDAENNIKLGKALAQKIKTII